MSTKKEMKLVDGYTGKMECKTCGSIHYAALKSGGGYHRGAWQCSWEQCPAYIERQMLREERAAARR